MTCIVGVASEGKVVIGADSAGVGGLDLTVRADRKVFRNGPMVMGFTSSFRMGQLLAHSLTVPKRHPDNDLMHWMVVDFINAVRECLKAGGFTTVSNGVETGGTFLVGVEGRLFHVEEDFQVGELVHPFDACGCGQAYALGALLGSGHLAARDRVETALAAAVEFSAGVRGPFHFEEV